jgi:hypothetical protein
MIVRYTTRLDWLSPSGFSNPDLEIGTESKGDGFPGSWLGYAKDLLGSESYRSAEFNP